MAATTRLRDWLRVWWLVIGGHISIMCAGGIHSSLAVFIDDIVHEFDASTAIIGWTLSMYAIVFGLVSPLASCGLNRFGCRTVVMIGGLFAAAGIFVMSFSSHIAMIGISYSFISGCGISAVYTASTATIRQHYTKNCAFAIGATITGVSTAVFVFPPLIRLLITAYGWRGALGITSAFMLHTTVVGAVLRPSMVRDRAVQPTPGGNNHLVSKQTQDHGNKPDVKSSHDAVLYQPLDSDGDTTTENVSNSEIYENGESYDMKNLNRCPVSGVNGSFRLRKDASCEQIKFRNSKHESIDQEENSDSVEKSIQFKSTFSQLFSISEQPLSRNTRACHALLFTCVFFLSSTYTTVSLFLAAVGTSQGLTPLQAASLLSATGISQGVGRFSNGIFVARGCIRATHLYIVLQILMALSVVVLGTLTNIYFVALLASLGYGLSSGGIVSLNIVVQRVIDDHVTPVSLGWLIFFEGIGGTIGGLASGWFRDTTGNFMLTFLVAGGVTLLSAALNVIILVMKRRETTTTSQTVDVTPM